MYIFFDQNPLEIIEIYKVTPETLIMRGVQYRIPRGFDTVQTPRILQVTPSENIQINFSIICLRKNITDNSQKELQHFNAISDILRYLIYFNS